MTKDEALIQYRALLEFRDLSPNTIKNYIFYIKGFLDSIQNEELSSLTANDALAYVSTLKEIGWNHKTLNVIICTIRYFYEAVLDIPLNRKKFPTLIIRNNDPIILSKEQIVQLLETKDIRLRVIISLGFDCGLRASEITALRIKDVDSKNMLLHIKNSKRGKSRTVKLSDFCLDTLREFWKIYRQEDYFFPNRDKTGHLHPNNLHKLFIDYMKELGLYEKGIHIHTLRHTFATNMLNEGCDIYTLKKILGHSSYAATANYIHMTNQNIQNTFSLSDKWEIR